MKFELREDCRTLREFYPDPGLRHRVHAEFAHRFVPSYFHASSQAHIESLDPRGNPGTLRDPTRFIQSRWHGIFEPGAGLVSPESVDPLAPGACFRRVTDLSMSFEVVAGRSALLIRMPVPENPIEAYFVCVVQAGSEARIFTLEKTLRDESDALEGGVLCEWARDGVHHNFGILVAAQKDAVLKVCGQILEMPGVSPSVSLKFPVGGPPAAVPDLAPKKTPPVPPSEQPVRPTASWWKMW